MKKYLNLVYPVVVAWEVASIVLIPIAILTLFSILPSWYGWILAVVGITFTVVICLSCVIEDYVNKKRGYAIGSGD